MKKYLITAQLATICLFLAAYVFSGTVTVPGDAPTIQGGIDLALDYDTVLVLPGDYSENIYLLDRVVSIIGVDGPLVTRLEPFDINTPVLSVFKWTSPSDSGRNNMGGQFSGFTVSGGGAGFIVYIDGFSSIVIRNNIFHDNIPFGDRDNAVIVCRGDSSEPTIMRNIFYANNGMAAVLIMEGAAQVINNTFDNNMTGLISNSVLTVALNNIITNSFTTGVNGDYARLDYNNVWGNTSDYG